MNEKCTLWRACVWSNLEMVHWICALNSRFLLRFSLVFVYVLFWNDSINGGKNLRCGFSHNYHHPTSGSNIFACNPVGPWWGNRYVVKEEFVQPLKIILKLKMSYYHKKTWKEALKELNWKTFKAAQKSCVGPNSQIVKYYWKKHQ